MKKRHYILISSLVIIPLVSQLVLMRNNRKAQSTTHQEQVQTTVQHTKQPQHIVVELLNCRQLDNDTSLKELIEDVLDTLNPSLHWSRSQIKSFPTYVVAALDDLYCAIQVRPKQSFYVDLYSDDTTIDPKQVLTALKQELTPTEVRHHLINV